LSRPATSAVNFEAGAVMPNAVVVPVGASGEVCVWTNAATNVLVDVSAWFPGAGSVGLVSGRLLDTRYGIGPIPTP
jgi:hypothetical protein